MATKGYPPISPGTSVRTTQANWGLCKEWTEEGWASKKWGVRGKVLTHHDSHGLCYEVRHEDGTVGCYDPSELEVICGVNLDELQEETEKLLALLKDRQPGLMTWHEFLHERLQNLYVLISKALGK